VIIADTQNNPHSGTNSNTTGMLPALVCDKAQEAALDLTCEPEVAGMAHESGRGCHITAAMGGKSGILVNPRLR
jgi:microcystin degradation protein MlrC